MPRGKRETAFWVVAEGRQGGTKKNPDPPLEVLEFSSVPKFRKWVAKSKVRVHSDMSLAGKIFGQLLDGRACIIIKGKRVLLESSTQPRI